ncbi:MAG: hypothetical protein ACREFR_04000 [Limisphaerales bacterium]
MKRQTLISWCAAALAGAGFVFGGWGCTGVQHQPTSSVTASAAAPDPMLTVANHQLTGAELYEINCNRCHQERYPTERTGAQWKTILLHMQVRANIPVSQAKLILQFLQENSGR